MIPCRYCGGTPELCHHRAEFAHFSDDSYMVVCKNCGARTSDNHGPEVVKRQWDRECVMRLVKEKNRMQRYIEIDGEKIELGCCAECPLLNEGPEEAVSWCKHPHSAGAVTLDVLIDGRVADACPLRKVDG